MKSEYSLFIIMFMALAALWPGDAGTGMVVVAQEFDAINSSQNKAPVTETVPISPEAFTEQVGRVVYDSELLGNLTNRSLREASGLALSTRSSKLAWSHNDSGYGPFLFVFDMKGEDRGRFYLQNASSGDWEDMAAFK